MRTYFRVEHDLPEHPKILNAGPLASWLHLCAIAWSGRHLTDGHIPRAKVPTLVDWYGIGLAVDPANDGDHLECWAVNAVELAHALVEVGLWEDTGEGFLIHNYLEYQRSRSEVVDNSQRRREQARAAGQRRAETAGRVAGSGRFAKGQVKPADTSASPAKPPAPHQQKSSPDTDTDLKTSLVLVKDLPVARDPDQPREVVENLNSLNTAERILRLCDNRKLRTIQQANRIARHLDKHLDHKLLIDPILGFIASSGQPIRSPNYVLKIATDWAAQRGVQLPPLEEPPT